MCHRCTGLLFVHVFLILCFFYVYWQKCLFLYLRLVSKKEETALQTSLNDAMKEATLFKSDSVESESEDVAPDLPQIRG